MSFSFGFPRVLGAFSKIPRIANAGKGHTGVETSEERLVCMRALPQTSRYIAVLSTHRLSIFSGGQHRVLLFEQKVTELYPQENGKPLTMVWAPRTRYSIGHTLVIVTESNKILSFTVEVLPHRTKPNSTPCPPVTFTEEPQFNAGRPLMVRLDYASDILLEAIGETGAQRKVRVSCISESSSVAGFFVGLSDGRVLLLSWKFNSVHEVSLCDTSADHESADAVISVAYSPALGVLGVALASGAATLVFVKMEQEGTEKRLVCGRCEDVPLGLHEGNEDKVCTLTFNRRGTVLTAGTREGRIAIVKVNALDKCEVVKRNVRQFETGETGSCGAITSLDWSLDDSMLAAGYRNGGICVFDQHGYRMGAIVEHASSSHNEIKHLCWTVGQFSLLYLQNEFKLEIPEITLHHLCTGMTSAMHSSMPVFLGTNSLTYLKSTATKGLETENPWHTAFVPDEYIKNGNWPVVLVATDGNGDNIAIAAKEAFAVLNTTRDSWFVPDENMNKESSWTCLGLGWCGPFLVAVQRKTGTKEVYLIVYEIKTPYTCRTLGMKKLTKEPAQMGCCGTFVVCLAGDKTITQYQLVFTAEDGVLKGVDIIEVKQLPVFVDTFVEELAVLPPEAFAEKSSILSPPSSPPLGMTGSLRAAVVAAAAVKVLLLDENGALYLLDTLDGGLQQIGENVKFFWISSERLRNSAAVERCNTKHLPLLFTFGADGMTCWHSLPTGGLRKQTRRLRTTETGDDVYPIGVDASTGKIIGATQTVSYVHLPEASTITHIVEPLPPLPFSRVVVKTNPFVQTLLYEVLASTGDHVDVASAVATHFSQDQDYLTHVLELLLYDAFEASNDEAAGDREKNAFARVVEFLRRRKDFPCVVVRCARKMDSSTWEPFFAVVGDPSELFEQCLADTDMLGDAACYLKLLGETKDEETSLRCAERLLPKLLEASLYDLAAELLLFAHPQLAVSGGGSSSAELPSGCSVVLAHMKDLQTATPDMATRLRRCEEALAEHGITLPLFTAATTTTA